MLLIGLEVPEKKQRDPLLDHPAVKLHRDVIHLRANHIQRELIAETVDDSATGLRLWEATLVEYMGGGRNPKDVTAMLKNYKAMVDGYLQGKR